MTSAGMPFTSFVNYPLLEQVEFRIVQALRALNQGFRDLRVRQAVALEPAKLPHGFGRRAGCEVRKLWVGESDLLHSIPL